MDEVRREQNQRREEETINTTAMEAIQGENKWVGEGDKREVVRCRYLALKDLCAR